MVSTMTTELCPEDMAVRINTSQQIITTEPEEGPGAVGGARAGAGAGQGAGAGALDLGRRLLLAARVGDTPLVLALMAKGAPFTTDWLGTSPLHLAACNAHEATCGVLLRAGVSRDARTKVERTPLHLAAGAGHAAVAALLLAHGARPDVRDLLRMTPLHWAAERGHEAVASLLLRHGADPGAVSKFGKTPLQLAARRGHTALQRLLEDAARNSEAARSVRALQAERLAEEPTEPPQQQQTFTTVQKLQEIKLPKIVYEKSTKENISSPEKEEESGGQQKASRSPGAAAALLRRHGITLLPPDHGGTVLSALQGGRTVVLSDAGKLMLKESVEAAAGPSAGRGLVVRRGARGVRLLAVGGRSPDVQQVKLVQVSKAGRPVGSLGSVGSGGRRGRAPVKIIMNKSNFERLVGAHRLTATGSLPGGSLIETETETTEIQTEEHEETIPEVSTDDETSRLRAELAASQRAVARLSQQLTQCRARLARYEPH